MILTSGISRKGCLYQLPDPVFLALDHFFLYLQTVPDAYGLSLQCKTQIPNEKTISSSYLQHLRRTHL